MVKLHAQTERRGAKAMLEFFFAPLCLCPFVPLPFCPFVPLPRNPSALLQNRGLRTIIDPVSAARSSAQKRYV